MSSALHGQPTKLSGAAFFPVTEAPQARTLVQIIQETIALYPAAPALDDGNVVLTYEALGERIIHVSRRLWSANIGAGDRVGVRVPSGSVDLYIAILGVLAAGAAYVPVDADEPEDRAETVWSEAAVCAVIGEGLELTLIGGVRTRGHSPEAHCEDDAWIIFTSGSTGKPKGVAITHRSAAALVDAETELYCVNNPLGPGDRVLAGLSVAFDASCEEMWLAWRNGACLVPAPRDVVRSGADLGPWLAQRHITVVSTVPTLAALWPGESLAKVRLLIFGGEACPADLVAKLASPTREVWNTYGPTEATVIACGALVDGQSPVRIGLPLHGYALAVVNADGEPVNWGEEGELVIGGVGLGRYLDTAKDAEKYAPIPALGWPRAYRSGDLVLADPAGLVFVGRADEQVKLAGRRVEMGEVDQALAGLPGVAAAAGAIQTSPSGNKVLAGYLVPAKDSIIDLGECRALLAKKLPAQLVPTLGIIEELPIKTSGKVDRKALPWPLGTHSQDSPKELTGELSWLAQQWRDLLGPVPLTEKSNFFAAGGASLAAAQLVSSLRARYPDISIADIYAFPTLGELATHLAGSASSVTTTRHTAPTPASTGWLQAAVIFALYSITGLRYITGIMIVCIILFHTGNYLWVPNPPLLPTMMAWVVLYSLPFRFLLVVACARLLLAGIRPGVYPRGGPTHLRLWTVERVATYCKLEPLMGTPMAAWYARALGCEVGKDVHLDAMPPVTGLATFGAGASIEREADLAGHWLDGDVLHIGRVRVDDNARVGTRSTLLNDSHVGAHAEIAPGTSVTGKVPAGQLWAGSQMEHVGEAGTDWPSTPCHGRPSPMISLLYPVSLFGLTLIPLVSVIPGGLLALHAIEGSVSLQNALWSLAAWSPVFLIATLVVYLTLTVALVRALSILLKPGFHPANGAVAWAAWLTEALLTKSLISTYPIYASLFTPVWMRMIGAHVGKHVEISTVETLPHLTRFADRSFLADHSMVSSKRVRNGWLHLGVSSVGKRSFVGNSAIVGPDCTVPDNSLLAVLSSAPKDMPINSSWFGRPPVELPRPVDNGDSTLTYNPPRHLLIARAAVEACRLLPAVITSWLALITVGVLTEIYLGAGFVVTVLWSGPVLLGSGVVASLMALAAKWVLVGRFEVTQYPLWTSFVWRNELVDVFAESLAVPGLIRLSLGTPILNWWMRLMGTKVGSGVWCETWWLPEFDLITLGSGVSVNRGTVLQTHLFHDRIMRMDEIRLDTDSTLGPNSIVLPGSTVMEGATVGAASLVMRSETVPAGTRWAGNPIRQWSPGAVPLRPRTRRH
ncbi:amino acid adenylation protein [Pseudarthrobacter sp. NamE2]|uniref:Pls/PosA family non-ribosomal peptide synthetase n=1 Tax=Pseudarthrobacter sp. NamE2 TaxID=2576838 RepID=UPI0010FF3BD0|nr:Pls/PosA family non-ribosomal peptide synthetase [Pseudarthrobacter sp. NamE2]TLM85370.1 amino acid adenylation protein [Pseudarthrobacter sp. NamE2]